MRGAAGTMLALAPLFTLSHLVIASADAAPSMQASSDAAYWAVVSGNSVNVRSGPSAQSAYAFGRLAKGDMVRVVREEFGWARVEPAGIAFAQTFAFVPADRRVSVAADGATATVTARTELRAPNIEAGASPDKSWKQIGTIEPGATLTVMGNVAGERETVYKVAVPASAEAWVNLQFLRRATDAEAMQAAAAAVAPAPATATTEPATTPEAATAAADSTPAATAAPAPTTAGTELVEVDPVRVAEPTNAPTAGAPAPATVAAPDFGTLPSSGPAIPPLMGQSPRTPDAATTTGTMTPAEPAKPAFVSRRATLDDLEQQFRAVRSQPEASAEFEALRARYQDLASAPDATGNVRGVAQARAQQLTLLTETQVQLQGLERRKAELDDRRRGIRQLVLDIQQRSEFTAVGVLNASAVYDGVRLPELYRICDPMTGATVAYVEPNAEIPMGPMIGTLVGVKGASQFDPALRLSVIAPLSVDLLTMRTEPQVTRTESTRPIEEAGTIAPSQQVIDGGPCPEDLPDFEPTPLATP
jgi:SH3-like domain-containing protein